MIALLPCLTGLIPEVEGPVPVVRTVGVPLRGFVTGDGRHHLSVLADGVVDFELH